MVWNLLGMENNATIRIRRRRHGKIKFLRMPGIRRKANNP